METWIVNVLKKYTEIGAETRSHLHFHNINDVSNDTVRWNMFWCGGCSCSTIVSMIGLFLRLETCETCIFSYGLCLYLWPQILHHASWQSINGWNKPLDRAASRNSKWCFIFEHSVSKKPHRVGDCLNAWAFFFIWGDPDEMSNLLSSAGGVV